YLYTNTLTTLPAGIFEGLTALETLKLDGNELECLPTSILVEVHDDVSFWGDGLHVDLYGDECGCSVANVTDNVCGEEACTPGPVGYTCATTSTPEQTWTSDSTPIVVGIVSAV
ncbi:unnamed protein product, partial [Ectocarpus sp. 6 AP-2014]